MKIIRQLRVVSVEFSNTHGTPIKILLDRRSDFRNPHGIHIDHAACSAHGIPMTPYVVGKNITCSFESVNASSPGYRDYDPDALHVKELRETHQKEIVPSTPPRLEDSRTNELYLETPRDGSGVSEQPSPFYHFVLELTDAEAEEYTRAQPLITGFKLKFRMAD